MSSSNVDTRSFPIQTNVKNINDYYSSIKNTIPKLQPTFQTRSSPVRFSDDSRISGEINEIHGSSTASYNNNNYSMYNVQLTGSTHNNWILKNKENNKIDIIITYERQSEITKERFIILVIPLIIDNNTTINNIYLDSMINNIQYRELSLGALYIREHKFYYYTTELDPHNDIAAVYVDINGINITQEIYYKLLALWKSVSYSTILSQITSALNPVQKGVSDMVDKIKSTNDVNAIQTILNNASSLAQSSSANRSIELWPAYVPPYDIILNVPKISKTMKSIEMFVSKKNIKEGFDGVDDNNGAPEQGAAPAPATATAPATVNIENVKCVSLDLDGVIDSNKNINFDIKGNMKLSEIQEERNKLRLSYEINTKNNVSLLNKLPDEQQTNYWISFGSLMGIFLIAAVLFHKFKIFVDPLINDRIRNFAGGLAILLAIITIFMLIPMFSS